MGITNLVNRATATAGHLDPDELREGGRRLRRKVCRYRPAMVAFLGISAYRVAFHCPKAVPGPRAETICEAAVWLLPNPSGLNAHYQLPELAAAFRELLRALDQG